MTQVHLLLLMHDDGRTTLLSAHHGRDSAALKARNMNRPDDENCLVSTSEFLKGHCVVVTMPVEN